MGYRKGGFRMRENAGYRNGGMQEKREERKKGWKKLREGKEG